MKRLLVVYNPYSSRFKDVECEVLSRVRDLKGYMVGKYEIAKIGVDENVKQIAKIIRDGDLVLSVGGDATAVVAANGIITSGKDATLSVLPYGNFNDLARTLRTRVFDDVFAGETKEMWPLDVLVDGKHWRYATCYVTLGMTGEAVEIFDNKKVRKNLQKGRKSSWRSYVNLAKWYFKNRHKKQYIPDFKLNGKMMHKKTSDFAAVNGRSMCRVMKGGDWFLQKEGFLHMTDRLANFFRLASLMIRSILKRVPGTITNRSVIEFLKPSAVEIQAEGEYRMFENISKIEVRKSEKSLKVVILK